MTPFHEFFEDIKHTIRPNLRAAGQTCSLLNTPDVTTCQHCPAADYENTSSSVCTLNPDSPEYITFLQEHFPELLI